MIINKRCKSGEIIDEKIIYEINKELEKSMKSVNVKFNQLQKLAFKKASQTFLTKQ